MPGLVVSTLNGVLAPAGTPRDVIARLHAAIETATRDPSLKQLYGALGSDIEVTSPERFAARIRDDFERWSQVIKDAGLEAQ